MADPSVAQGNQIPVVQPAAQPTVFVVEVLIQISIGCDPSFGLTAKIAGPQVFSHWGCREFF
jgi:hypothetical protein